MSGVAWPRDRLLRAFWLKVGQVGNVCECWPWLRAKDKNGYGRVDRGVAGTSLAHRVAYTLVFGPTPPDLPLDHLCRNTSCVNPWHLEPVTHGENTRRSTSAAATRAFFEAITHCPSGHAYDNENTCYRSGTRKRACRACARARYHAGKDRNGTHAS